MVEVLTTVCPKEALDNIIKDNGNRKIAEEGLIAAIFFLKNFKIFKEI